MTMWERWLVRGLDSNLKDFLKRSAVVSIMRIAGLLCVFALQLLLARLMGDSEEYGKYAWGQSILFLGGTLAAMGIPIVTARFVASLSAQQNHQSVPEVIGRSRALLLRSSGFLLMLSLALALYWSNDSSGDFHKEMLVLALLLAPSVSFLLLYQNIAMSRQWFILAFLPMWVLRPVTTALLALALWWISGNQLDGEDTVLLVGLSVLLVTLPQALIYYRRERAVPGNEISTEDNTQFKPSALFATSLPVFVTRIAGLVVEYSNILLLGLLAGPAATGAYFAAERLALLAFIPSAIVGSVNQAGIAAAYATNDKTSLKVLVAQAAHGKLWPCIIIAVALMSFSGPLLSLFGDDFSNSAPVLMILALGQIVRASTGASHELLVMSGRQKLLPGVMISTAIFHVVLLSLLLPTFSAGGAAVASVASGALSSFWVMILVRRELAINPTVLAGRKSRTVKNL
jgi:O-antigen/teichoic acid export membrane protein